MEGMAARKGMVERMGIVGRAGTGRDGCAGGLGGAWETTPFWDGVEGVDWSGLGSLWWMDSI